jgi:hypothetical protein
MAALAGTASLTLVNGRVRVAHAGWVSRFARRHRSGQFFVFRFSFFVFRFSFGTSGRLRPEWPLVRERPRAREWRAHVIRPEGSLALLGEWQLRRIAASVTLRSSFFVLVLRFSFFVFRSERRAAFGRNGRSCGNGLALVNGGLTSFARKDLSLCSGEWQLRRIAASVTLRSSFFVLRSSF